MSNVINILNDNGLLVVTSREVSENFEKRHKHVLESINNLITNMNSAEKSAKYFIPTEYKDCSGKSNKEFLLTRDGFSLLVMGFTGAKALGWKLKYIEAFNKMDQALRKQLSPMEQLRLQYQVIEQHEEKLIGIEKKVDSLEANMPLFNVECKELQTLVRKVGTKALGGYRSPAYIDNSLRGKVYTDIQHQLKREFGVERYEAIKRCQLETAKEIVTNYKLPFVLEDDINTINHQIVIKEVACTKQGNDGGH